MLAGVDNSPPLIFNRINIGFRFDTEHKQVVLAQADISNGEVGVAGTGSIDYSGEPLIKLGFAGTPMSASALKRIWPALIVPEVREWVIDRIDAGTLQRVEIGVNTLVKNLPRKGPPIPDDGLSVNIVANGVAVRPVTWAFRSPSRTDGMPSTGCTETPLATMLTARPSSGIGGPLRGRFFTSVLTPISMR